MLLSTFRNAAVIVLAMAALSFGQNKSVAVNHGETNNQIMQAGGWDTTVVNWTVEGWIKFEALPASGNESHFMEFWEGGSGYGGQLYANSDGFLTTNGNGYATGLTGETEISTGTWYHVAYVLDGDNDLNTVYLNGEEEMSGTASQNSMGVAEKVMDSLAISQFRGIKYGCGWCVVKGNMDEVRVWYRALSQEEIQARMDSAITKGDGLEAVYNFDDPENIGKDATGNGHDLDLLNVDGTNASDDAPTLKMPTAIEEQNGTTPNQFHLAQNYPNPFNPSTRIEFAIKKNSNVELAVYNMLGEKVAVLASGNMNAGNYSATFEAGDLANGVYFYKLTAGNFTSVKKMILMK